MNDIQEEILRLCKSKAVSFTLHYDESQDMWWGSIGSPAKEECFTTSDSSSLDLILSQLKEHLETL